MVAQCTPRQQRARIAFALAATIHMLEEWVPYKFKEDQAAAAIAANLCAPTATGYALGADYIIVRRTLRSVHVHFSEHYK